MKSFENTNLKDALKMKNYLSNYNESFTTSTLNKKYKKPEKTEKITKFSILNHLDADKGNTIDNIKLYTVENDRIDTIESVSRKQNSYVNLNANFIISQKLKQDGKALKVNNVYPPNNKHSDYKSRQQFIESVENIAIANASSDNVGNYKEQEIDDLFRMQYAKTEGNEEEQDFESSNSKIDNNLEQDCEEHDGSGVLSYDEVKDIIMCIDFRDYDIKDKNLFHKNERDIFKISKQSKYENFLFPNFQNNPQTISPKAENHSGSTKDSSSNKRNYISVIKLVKT